jgi:hypothetical protein
MSAQGTQRHSSASQSKGIVIRSTTTPYSGELPLLIRSNISQKYTARGREQFSFRDWLNYGARIWKIRFFLRTVLGDRDNRTDSPLA